MIHGHLAIEEISFMNVTVADSSASLDGVVLMIFVCSKLETVKLEQARVSQSAQRSAIFLLFEDSNESVVSEE